MKSAVKNPQVIRDYLDAECRASRVMGPLSPADYPFVHTSRLGVIHKNTLGKWRLIVDMSSPEDGSVNDGIREAWCSLSYTTVDDAIQGITSYGAGAQLVKVDIRSAYRVILVHPDDRWLIRMLWEGSLFIDTALPFSLRSAPKIFTTSADAAEWIVCQRRVNFVIDGNTTRGYQGEYALRILVETFEKLGLPIVWNKLEGPSTRLTFLGFELNSIQMEVRLPFSKLEEAWHKVQRWSGKKSIIRKDLELVVGRLASFRASVELWTDASGSFGCGALCPMLSRWIQLPWKGVRAAPVSVDNQSITWMPLF